MRAYRTILRLFSLFSCFTSLRSCRIYSARLIAFLGVRSIFF
nr:MAG TPA: hypothetical protein [Inoviridae sp.]